MKSTVSITLLLFLGCASVPNTPNEISLPEPPYIKVYYDDEFLGALQIEEKAKTRLPFETFVDSGPNDKMGIGVEIIAEGFSITDNYADGHLEVTYRLVAPDAPIQEIGELEIPVVSERSLRSDLKLKSGSALYMDTDPERGMISGYDLDISDGWRLMFVGKEDTEPDDAGNGGNAPGEEPSP